MRLAAVTIAALLVSITASGAQDVAAEQDIVVIARRMRLVRLDYALNGPHLRRCDVEVSSGDARVDRVMCAVLKRCVMAGYREPKPAKLCMDASVNMFVTGERRPPEPDLAATPSPTTELRATLRPDHAYTAPASGSDSDIVVTADKNKPAGGEWRFTKLSSSGRGHFSQAQWRRCIPDGEVEGMLRMMLNGEETRGSYDRCGAMKIKIKLGRIEGNRLCLSQRARMKTLVQGTVNKDKIVAAETTYLVASLGSRPDYAITVPEDDSVSNLYGKRIGECSATYEAENGQQLGP